MKINLIFWGYLLLFLADNIVNQFVHWPVFVSGGMLLSIALVPVAWPFLKKHPWIWMGLILLFLIMVINSFRFGFHEKNMADLFFLYLFVLGYGAYHSARNQLRYRHAAAFMVMALLMLAGPLVVSLAMPAGEKQPEANIVSLAMPAGEKQPEANIERVEIAFMPANNNPNPGAQQDPPDTGPGFMLSDDFLEEYRDFEYTQKETDRVYRPGVYRIPHVAAYFLGFSAVFLAFIAVDRKQYLWFLPAVFLLLLSSYTGCRACITALAMATLLYWMHKRRWPYVLAAAGALAFIIVFRHEILNILSGTFLHQQFALVVTLTDNIWRLSRLMIWAAWFWEVSGFAWYELIIGRSYVSGLTANAGYFGQPLWYHNDFLNMFYTYGIVGLAFYTGFFARMYMDFKQQIRSSFFVFVFFNAVILLAVLNGFYYFFPVFLFYLYFLMLKTDRVPGQGPGQTPLNEQ